MTIESTLVRDTPDDVMVASATATAQLKSGAITTQSEDAGTGVIVRNPAQKGAAARKDKPDDELAWQLLWSTGSVVARNRLVEMHLHLVDAVVRRLPYDILRHWGADDLKGFGVFGLIDAVERRQPELSQLSFSTYANTRIRGAIYDELRALDWLPRTARRKAIDFKRTEDELRCSLRRNPDFDEVLLELQITSPTQVKATARAVRCSQIASLEGRLNQDSPVSKGDHLASSDDVEMDLFSQADQQELSDAIASLSERERAILSYRYRDRLTLQEVGDLIGVSCSRICQIEQATLRDLRRILEVADVA
ncbi:MAG TPA: sigma-70 family RNA polymerase sigma factor [Acidimicrobiales bacterium]